MLKYSLIFTFLFSSSSFGIHSLCEEVFRLPAQRAHQSITTDLYNGSVVEGKEFNKNDNRNIIYKVKLLNENTGRYREAIFKPRYYGDADGWNRVTMEYVAYDVNLKLGMDYIPPVAYRKNLNIDGKHFDEGALLHFVDDPHELHEVADRLWDLRKKFTKADKDLFLSDVRILDVLMQNPDRHINNFMRGKHWVDGVYKPVIIDHAANFRRLDSKVSLLNNDAFGNGAVKMIRKRTYHKLKGLKRQDLDNLKEFLSEKEVDFIFNKRDEIIKYFDELIESRGRDTVLRGEM